MGIIKSNGFIGSEPMDQSTGGIAQQLKPTSAVAGQSVIVPQCNICGNSTFLAFNGRAGEQCGQCYSLRRHRMAFALYTREGVLQNSDDPRAAKSVLHLAPESALSARVSAASGSGYVAADANPKAYGIPCMKVNFPDDFKLFPDGQFDFILHNHVLEHIPGSFRDHVNEFCRMLKPGGCMIFSVPGPTTNRVTIEGGEHLSSDAERLAKFGQRDHLKLFGQDLAQYMASIPGGDFSLDGLSSNQRAQISIPPMSTRFLLWRRHR